jgi:hypothetical protein
MLCNIRKGAFEFMSRKNLRAAVKNSFLSRPEADI